ncbi:MAG: hypothetical protein LH628_16400 [Microcoleus sp. CAN_BIN18]|nr:hypothetical protein [Microcoleus sp. CAN_BIN18]
MQPIRQCDVILTPTEQIQGQKKPHLTLAEGEVTGHSSPIVSISVISILSAITS